MLYFICLMFPRRSAHEIEFAVQIPKKREHVSLFFDLRREKVSARELSDDFGTTYGPFLLVGETTVSPTVIRQVHLYIIAPCIHDSNHKFG